VAALTQSSDSLVPIGRPSGRPLSAAGLGAGAWFCAWNGRPRGHPPHAARRSLVTGSPRPRVHPRRNEGLPGAWAVLFVRAVADPPAGSGPPLPLRGAAPEAFGLFDALGTRNGLFVAASPRPTRSRAYASPVALPPPAPGSLPTRAGSPRSGGFRTRRTTYEVSPSHRLLDSSPTSLAWSHRRSAPRCTLAPPEPSDPGWAAHI